MSGNINENGLLEEEYEHVPVPLDKRKSFAHVSAVWYSFPMVLTSAVVGGVITANLEPIPIGFCSKR